MTFRAGNGGTLNVLGRSPERRRVDASDELLDELASQIACLEWPMCGKAGIPPRWSLASREYCQLFTLEKVPVAGIYIENRVLQQNSLKVGRRHL